MQIFQIKIHIFKHSKYQKSKLLHQNIIHLIFNHSYISQNLKLISYFLLYLIKIKNFRFNFLYIIIENHYIFKFD